MHFRSGSRAIAFCLLTGIVSADAATVCAEETDARLKQRIAELQTENRALRAIIARIQGALGNVPKSSLPSPPETGVLRIIVLEGDWGGSQPADIKKVCESAGGAIAAQLSDDDFAPIIVERGTSAPITLFQRGAGNEYVVRLNTQSRRWAQCGYQFAHEFCHIVCNYRNVENPQMWFEETLCETASLYALRRMAVEWKSEPPYPNWAGYSAALGDYASERIKKYDGRKETAAAFYRANQEALEKTATNRELNSYIALKLLPLFEATPTAWQALRYLNLGPASENTSFQAYLSGWHDRVPAAHKPFAREIAAVFDIELTPELNDQGTRDP